MSDYLEAAQAAKKKLASVSDSFCLAKFMQTTLHLTTGHTSSCYHPPLHKINRDDIADIPMMLNYTREKCQQQDQMFRGERPSGCEYCWRLEDQGSLSDRHYRSGEHWAQSQFDKIVQSRQRSDPEAAFPWPTYVEVNFNHACNLKCSYCSPQFSSTWEQEAKQCGAYPTSTPHNDPQHFTGDRRPIPNREYNPYRETFWQLWPQWYKHLQHFRMTGGEPTLDPNTYRVFDYVLANPKQDLHLNVTSNFSVDDSVFEKYMGYVHQLTQGENIEHFMQFVSLDTWGSQAEYIRHGLNFDVCQNRIEQFVRDIPYRSSLTLIITMSNLNIVSLKQLLEYVLYLRKTYTQSYQRIWFDLPMLTTPEWQSMQILPASYSICLEECLDFMQDNLDEMHGFKDYEVLKLQRNLDWMQGGTDDIERKRADFYRFFSEHDRRRGTDFERTFPQMQEFWDTCRWLANE